MKMLPQKEILGKRGIQRRIQEKEFLEIRERSLFIHPLCIKNDPVSDRHSHSFPFADSSKLNEREK